MIEYCRSARWMWTAMSRPRMVPDMTVLMRLPISIEVGVSASAMNLAIESIVMMKQTSEKPMFPDSQL